MVLTSLPPFEIRKLRSRGERLSAKGFDVFLNKNDLDKSRLAVIVSKKISPKAVDRNRVKRLMKEAFRALDLGSGSKKDILVVATHKEIIESSLSDVVASLQGVIPTDK